MDAKQRIERLEIRARELRDKTMPHVGFYYNTRNPLHKLARAIDELGRVNSKLSELKGVANGARS